MEDGSWRPRSGERVRVRATFGEGRACPDLPHYPDEAGHTGTVYVGRPREGAPGHPYLVQFDRPVPVVKVMGRFLALPARHYAADELEPIE